MSSVLILKSTQFTIICADRVAFPTNARGERLRARTHKVFRAAPGIYAAAVGAWEQYTGALNNWARGLPELVAGERNPAEIAAHLSSLLQAGDTSGLQNRVYLVFGAPYLADQDASTCAHSIVILQGQGYPPKVSPGGAVALPSSWLTQLFLQMWEHPETLQWRMKGALAQAQLIEAFQTMAAMLSPDLDQELDTIIVGPEDRYTNFRGGLLELPVDYIL